MEPEPDDAAGAPRGAAPEAAAAVPVDNSCFLACTTMSEAKGFKFPNLALGSTGTYCSRVKDPPGSWNLSAARS